MQLSHKRILVTAPRQYAQKLSSLLIDAGTRPIWIPTIEITPLPVTELRTVGVGVGAGGSVSVCLKIDVELKELSDHSHIAFTSRNGIKAVFDRLQKLYPLTDDLVEYIQKSGVQICTLGADADALMQYHVQPNIQPADASTLGLVRELQDRHELEGARILCPVPSVRGGLTEPVVVPRFLKALGGGGADVKRLDVYITQPGCPPEACTAEKLLLENGHIDAIVFSSTAEAQGLVHAMGPLSALKGSIQKHSTLLAAHGPFTAAGVSNCLGLEVPCVSQNYSSFQGVISALETAFDP